MHSYAEQESETQRRPDRGSSAEPKRRGRSATAGGLPPRLRANLEAMSGFTMDDVRVHRNSSEPARLGALAFARGTDIHLGPGQDRHLAHEAWHVVQQKQGRVTAATVCAAGPVSLNPTLEAEADKFAGGFWGRTPMRAVAPAKPSGAPVVQLQPKEPPIGIPIEFDKRALRHLGMSTKDLARATPAFLIRLFQREYGLFVAIVDGRLVYIRDAKTSKSVSPTAAAMWKEQLTKSSNHALRFTAGRRKVQYGENIPVEATGGSESTIDLADFYLSGDMGLRDAVYKSLEVRAANLARVLEHETLGHGVMKLTDAYDRSRDKRNHGAYRDDLNRGDTVDFGNLLSKEMGLPLRTVYTAPAGRAFTYGRRKVQMTQFTFAKDGVRGVLLFNEGVPLGFTGPTPDWYRSLVKAASKKRRRKRR